METAVKDRKPIDAGDVSRCVEEAMAEQSHKKGYLITKRIFDIVVALCAGIGLLIPMGIICLLIRMESEGPAIFAQERMGKDGKVFVIYKFRTMKITAPKELASRDFAGSNQYITRMGAVLRRTSIDELPQLYNVLRGDMSLVGYRPVCLTEVRLNELRKELGVFTMRPGITGLAQVSGRDNIIREKEKALLDARYVRQCGWKMDLWCLKETVATVWSGKGVN